MIENGKCKYIDMSNLSVEIGSKKNYIILVKKICEKYKLDPAIGTNITNINAFLRPLESNLIAQKFDKLDDANNFIVEQYAKTMEANRMHIVKNINVIKDYMIKQINIPGDDTANGATAYADTFVNRKEGLNDPSSGIESILGMDPNRRIAAIRYLNYQSLFRDEYIVIDSRYQNTVNTDPTKIEFTLITNTKTRSDHGGVIVGNALQDIVEIEIYPFTIPYKPVYSTFYNKITLSINEWSTNSFEAYEGGQFHFEFDIDHIDNNLIYLNPINNKFSFSNPVNRIDSFSLSFGAVYPKISFDDDRMSPSYIDFTDPLGIFTFNQPHNLVTGDLVYIMGFNTPDPAQDVDMINIINRAEGHTIVKKNNYSFIINIDLTTVRHENPVGSGIYPIDTFDQLIVIYFASKRIQIQMRLTYLTNYT